MTENKKAYVRVTYLGDKLSSINIICDLVSFSFVDDVEYYTNSDKYITQYDNDKFIAKMIESKVTYELFICNYNEISNYLH